MNDESMKNNSLRSPRLCGEKNILKMKSSGAEK